MSIYSISLQKCNTPYQKTSNNTTDIDNAPSNTTDIDNDPLFILEVTRTPTC